MYDSSSIHHDGTTFLGICVTVNQEFFQEFLNEAEIFSRFFGILGSVCRRLIHAF